MTMHNACTWINCQYLSKSTEAMTDNGRAWGHLCPTHKRQYDAEIKANNGIDYSPKRMHDLLVRAAGGEESWRRFLFGPFGKREKSKADDEHQAV